MEFDDESNGNHLSLVRTTFRVSAVAMNLKFPVSDPSDAFKSESEDPVSLTVGSSESSSSVVVPVKHESVVHHLQLGDDRVARNYHVCDITEEQVHLCESHINGASGALDLLKTANHDISDSSTTSAAAKSSSSRIRNLKTVTGSATMKLKFPLSLDNSMGANTASDSGAEGIVGSGFDGKRQSETISHKFKTGWLKNGK